MTALVTAAAVAEARKRIRAESERVAPAGPRVERRFRLLGFSIGAHTNLLPEALLPVPCHFLTVNCVQQKRATIFE